MDENDMIREQAQQIAILALSTFCLPAIDNLNGWEEGTSRREIEKQMEAAIKSGPLQGDQESRIASQIFLAAKALLGPAPEESAT